jgi:hypothetical protein
MSISYYDFNNLSKESQLELVMAEEKLISEAYKNDLKFVLYEISFFSVEIVYSMINDKIASFSVFQNMTTK